MTSKSLYCRFALLTLLAASTGALLLFGGDVGSDSAWAQEGTGEKPKAEKTYEARLYEVYIFKSGLDIAHGHGTWVKEVHVPELGLSFNKAVGSLLVFPEKGGRYAFTPLSQWGDFHRNAKLVTTFRISAKQLAILKACGRFMTEAEKVLKNQLGG